MDEKIEKPVVFLNRKRKIDELQSPESSKNPQKSKSTSPKNSTQTLPKNPPKNLPKTPQKNPENPPPKTPQKNPPNTTQKNLPKTPQKSPQKNPPFQPSPQIQTNAIDDIPEIDRQTITKMLHNMIGKDDDDNAVLAPRRTEINLFPQSGIAKAKAEQFWGDQLEAIQSLTNSQIFKPSIPLARIKKIMKMDENVKMISGEVPHLFAKAAEIFITELTLKSWIHTEDSKRRTLQRNDVSYAIAQCDMFDFLIDIVPREEFTSQKIRQDDLDKIEEKSPKLSKETPKSSEKPSENPSENQLTYELAGQLTENGQKSVVVEINGKKYRLEADK